MKVKLRKMNQIAERLRNFAARPEDSENESFMKLLILIIALSCCICGVMWSTMYYFVFGFGLTMILPFVFVVTVGGMIIISDRIKNHRPLIYAQLICITWLPAFVQWSIGGIGQSGLVIAWSFLGPLGALIFLSVRQAIIWMLIFTGIVIVSVIFEPALLGYKLEVSNQIRMMFFIMNPGVSTIIVFGAAIWFVKTIQFERGRSESLLEKIQTLFGQHVSREIATELIAKDSNEATSKAYNLTVMFLDIRDFTVFADSRSPKEVATFQNTVFGELIKIVRTNKGIVNQILGDGIMAVFGAPIANKTHISDAVKAGYVMLNKIKELSDIGEIPPIRVGIGLHTGKVIAGEVGNEFRKFYSLAGTNVIIAARIESLNKELKSQFLVSEAIYEKIKEEDNSAIFCGNKTLKGIAKTVGIYQLA